MRSTIRCGVCSACLTLLVSLDCAGGDVGRARVVFLFLFFLSKYTGVYSCVQVPTTVYVYKKHSGVAGRSLSLKFAELQSRLVVQAEIP